MIPFTRLYTQQTFTTARGKIVTSDTPSVGLVVQYNTSLMSDGHNRPRGYVVLQTFTRKNTTLVNKALLAYITSADVEGGTVTYNPARQATMRLSQAGRWKITHGGGSDPYISFGRLQVPWTAQEEEEFLRYSMGN
jgi:hypothetical protein